jgi:hypothetical protein
MCIENLCNLQHRRIYKKYESKKIIIIIICNKISMLYIFL